MSGAARQFTLGAGLGRYVFDAMFRLSAFETSRSLRRAAAGQYAPPLRLPQAHLLQECPAG